MILEQFKKWMLPVAMIAGGAGYRFFGMLAWLTPWLIFAMLLVTYCKVSWHQLKIRPLHVWMLGVQVAGSMLVYGLIAPFDPVVAQGVFICVLAPTATSAAVVTGMLGGSVGVLATYTLLSNVLVAAASPFVFSVVGEHASLSFGASFWTICRQMVPMLILPLVGAFSLSRLLPRVHEALRKRQSISFYLWSVSLMIVMGRTVSFLVEQEKGHIYTELLIVVLTLGVCVAQFVIGRRIGRRYRNRIAGAQGLGQKNTVLAIWMANVYLNPVASIGPASYVVCQNIINSWQIWRKKNDKIQQESNIRL